MRWVEGHIKLRLAQSLYMRLSDCVQETKKLQAKVLNSTYRTILVCKLLQTVNLDGLTFLTALILFKRLDYLDYSNKNSD